MNSKLCIKGETYMKTIIIENLEELKTDKVYEYEINLIPLPIKYELGSKLYKLSEISKLIYDNIDNKLIQLIIEQINNRLSEFNVNPIKSNKKILSNNKRDLFNNKLKDFQKEQGYILEIKDNKCTIQAETEQGIYYGIQTLIQLLDNLESNAILPEITIIDYPLLKIRGISDDITRGQIPTVENVKKLIDLLSHYKMNFYFIGYESEFLKNDEHPAIYKTLEHLTKEEIEELQKYAKQHFIELIPFFQVLGHYDNILTLPDYIDLAEFPGSYCLNVSDENNVRKFLESIIKNIANTFETNYIHIGGDESWDFGIYKSKNLVKQKGIANTYLEHYLWVYNTIKKYGKSQMLIYHDIIVHYKKFLENFPKDVIMFFWKYFTASKMFFKKAKQLKNYGFSVIVSPTIYNWSRHFPDLGMAYNHIYSLYEYAKKNELLGGITSQWGDYGHEDLRPNHCYGYIFSAAVLWSDIDLNYFKQAMIYQLFGIKKNRDKLIKIIDILSSINNQFFKLPPFFFIKFWEHPFLHKNPKINIKKYNKIEGKSQRIFKLLDEVKDDIIRNRELIDYLELATKLASFIALKFKTTYNISKTLLSEQILDNPGVKEGIVKEIKYLIKLLDELKEKYKELWLKCAKPNGLKRILYYFNTLKHYYLVKIDEINKDINWTDPNHPAYWITTQKKVMFQKPRFYRKCFELNNIKSIENAYLQIISSHFAKIYLNGEYLGYVITRNSLSYLMMDNRVKVFNIKDKLKEGLNILAIESYNFISQKEGINVYAEFTIKEKEEKLILISDKSWKSCEKYYKDWYQIEFDDTNWNSVKIIGKSPKFNGRIIKPYFEANIKSHVNHTFAIQSMLEVSFPKFLKPFIKLLTSILNFE